MSHHIAIMNPAWKLIPKILSGEKVIESRWYQTRRAPWNTVKPGDSIYFKNSGEPVTAQAVIARVLQFTINSIQDVQNILATHGPKLCLINSNPNTWKLLPRYCILVFLTNPQPIKKPFRINKSGYGTGAAWITVKHIKEIAVIDLNLELARIGE